MMSKYKLEKRSNAINRTTSESLRLEPVAMVSLAPRKKMPSSSSSFQITAVSLTRAAPDDDSADDTDDISRVTDNETPSFSEDSRDADDHQEAQAMAMVPQVQPQPDRFKIVKMPSTATRGRWKCVDYFDDAAEIAYTSHYSEISTKAAGMKGFPQGYSSVLTNVGMGPMNLGNIENQVNQKKCATIQEEVIKKDDILSDIKVALTSMPATQSGSTNNNNIDRKIEEALDAVKTHLMLAVHKEVDFLKTRVSTLEGRVNELEIENSILRVNYLLFKS